MKLFRRENTFVIEEDFSTLVTKESIIAFLSQAIKTMTEEFAKQWIEEHKKELLEKLNHDEIIKMIELEIVKKFINK